MNLVVLISMVQTYRSTTETVEFELSALFTNFLLSIALIFLAFTNFTHSQIGCVCHFCLNLD